MIGKIQRAKLRDVWPNEAHDFTPWLQENIEVLAETTGLNLTAVEREQSAGSFSVDLVAESDSGLVVIENQLERSNHDHLGKVLTYLAQLGANTAIWIVSDPRPEHVTAIGWLNDSSPSAFYLVKLEAVKIGNSPPAALFTLITGPSEDSAGASETKRDLADRYRIRQRFWEQVLAHAKTKTKLHSGISASKYGWLGSGAGLPSGLGLNYVVRTNDTSVELYIDGGADSDDENLNRFNELNSKREAIEANFDGTITWEPLEDRRACRISSGVDLGGWKNEENWTDISVALVDRMINFYAVLKPYLK
ncbi:DUF4268 domain-containing protein [Candidatus Lucifugimonas marina]|uniref:DUF4268 domain-containing protein n=1 Tax=Candidatus Lucifugimonas marina TaxID=3038979 RepID=UPI00279F3012|nr:DUF4268 domain-containing protein [SAR202 cluster bacterium JH545]